MCRSFLQEDLRLAHGLACDASGGPRRRPRKVGAVGEGVLEEPELELRGQDPRHRVVDAGHRDVPSSTSPFSVGLERPRSSCGCMNMSIPALTPAATCSREGRPGPPRFDVVDAVVVGDHDPVEALLVLQPTLDQVAVGVHVDRVAEAVLGPVDVGVRRHHRADAVLLAPPARNVERQPLERRVVDLVDALVDRVVAGGWLFEPVPYVVSPSPAKCLAVASTRSLSERCPGGPGSRSIAVSIDSTRAGDSPNDS